MLCDAFADSFKGMILYGSCARGEQDDESDIDILVLLKDKDAVDNARARISELAGDLFWEHNKLVSAMPMAELDYQKGRSPFFLNVKREGILILTEGAFEMKSEIDRLMEIAHSSRDAAHELFESEEYTDSRPHAPTMPCSMRQRPRCCQEVYPIPDIVALYQLLGSTLPERASFRLNFTIPYGTPSTCATWATTAPTRFRERTPRMFSRICRYSSML